jgi:hypothetical protein
LRRRGWRASVRRGRERRLAVLAVEEVAHGLTAGIVRFFGGGAFVGGHAALGCGTGRFGGARFLCALGAAVGEARFIRLQLELLVADGADFDGKRHVKLR